MVNIRVSLDRLSLVGGIENKRQFERFLARDDYVMTGWINRVGIYRYTYQFVDGGVLQIADPSSERNLGVPTLRVEFNPNDCLRDGIERVLRYVKVYHLTRVDVAIDYFDVDLGVLTWLDVTGRRKRAEYRSASGCLETLYFGSNSSEKRFRIYDKAREQKDRSGRIWWRVEAQIRSDSIHGNPFSDIVAVLEYPGMTLYDRAMCYYLSHFPSAFAELSRKTRLKYRSMMKSAKAVLFSPQPSEVFEKEKARIDAELMEWLSCCCVDILRSYDDFLQQSSAVSQVVFGWGLTGDSTCLT